MLNDKHKNMAMIALAALILGGANLIVWMGVKQGVIAPAGNSVMWNGFIILNAASILWAVTLLGLQPMVISLSYVAGGLLAYKGVQGMGGVSVAEVTTAGATYGAFGALAVGNLTAKVRLAFYNRKQVPFIFIIAALLVLDAVLNSGVSRAGGNVILNAVVFPFVLAGVIIGLVWSVLVRIGIGRNPVVRPPAEAVRDEAVSVAPQVSEERDALMIKIPDDVEAVEEPEICEAVAEAEVETETQPVAEIRKPAGMPPASDETFFPLEIDKDEDFIGTDEPFELTAALDDAELDPVEAFDMESFDSRLYDSGILDEMEDPDSVEEPVLVDAGDPVLPDEETEELPVPAPEKKNEPAKSRPDDWLNGHLDLLNRLK